MPTHILGISAYYHDAAAALLRDGEIVAAAEEERFSREKGDARFPARAIASCLAAAGIGVADLDHVVFYEKPWLHFERLLETALAVAPRGFPAALAWLPPWLGGKLHRRRELRRALGWRGPVLFTEHHEAHQAAAFYPSPFPRAAILTVDGVGEWATTTWARGEGAVIHPGEELRFPHSLGLLYSAVTAYLGFRVNSGEYKVMGLAPYGEPRYVGVLRDEVVALHDDGSFRLDPRCFAFTTSPTAMFTPRLERLLGGPPRAPEGPLQQRHMDVARSLQAVTEEILLRLARHVHAASGEERLVLAGGVALNCVANRRLLREGPFREVWIQPAAGDAGGALGAALAIWHRHLDRPRDADGVHDAMRGAFLGPRFTSAEIRAWLDGAGARYRVLPEAEVAPAAARLLAAGKVVGFFHGRMEFGPRALGARSILGDPRSPTMQSEMNLKIKQRESFRPFAPAVLAERAAEYFDLDRPSPYMLLVADVAAAHRREAPGAERLAGLERLRAVRSDIPAVTHVDLSARLQTVDGVHQRGLHDVLRAFAALTGCPCLINTSFNVRGEPIVCTPEDAYRCFMSTAMDALILEDVLVDKAEQPPGDWRRSFRPD